MKKRIIAMTLLLGCLFLSGCSWLEPWLESEDEVIDPSRTPTTVLPPEQSGWEEVGFYLYYQVRDLVYMAPELRQLQDVSPEEFLSRMIGELLLGPADPELSTWFPEGTTLVEVSQTQDYVYVTLSQEFLDPPAEAPVNWQDDPGWKEVVAQRRRLALYSLVNTVTQLGHVSRVQVLVRGEDGQTVRLTRDELGLPGEDPTQPLEPLSREDGLIFTPEAAVQQLLEALTRKNWEAVASWTAQYDPLYGAAPAGETVVQELQAQDPSLLSYDLTAAQIVSGDLAIITLRLEQSGASGLRTVYESQPLRWVKEGSLWKLSYSSLQQLMSNAH